MKVKLQLELELQQEAELQPEVELQPDVELQPEDWMGGIPLQLFHCKVQCVVEFK